MRTERPVADRVLQNRIPRFNPNDNVAVGRGDGDNDDDNDANDGPENIAQPAFGGGGGFGGGFGGAPGGFGGAGEGAANNPAAAQDRNNPPFWDDVETTAYGVSGVPVILEGQVYVQADNAALYAFGTQPFDADPPLLTKPQLSILNTEGQPALQRLDAQRGWLGPGRGPVLFVANIEDTGSGVDPSSIRVTLNQQEVPATAMLPFEDTTGKLQVKLTPETPGGEAGRLTDGNQSITVQVRDYRGNELKYSTTFMVDNTLPQPAPETNERGRFRGRFGR